jgi:predicted component of type VI protein secretion system
MSQNAQARDTSAAVEQAIEQSELGALLRKEFKPDAVHPEVERAVHTLAAQALEHTQLISDDTIKSVRGMIAAIDEKLTEQVNQILHHQEFQKLEGAWRGLHHLVNNTETDSMLQIRVTSPRKICTKHSSATREQLGTKVRSSSACTKKSMARWVVSLTAVWSEIITSITVHPMSSSWRRCRRSVRPCMRR